MRLLLAVLVAVSSLLWPVDARAQSWSSDYFKKTSSYVRGYSLDGCPTNRPVWETTDAYSNVVITNISYTTNSTNSTITARTNVYACGGTSIIWYVKGWTFGPSTVDQTNNQSVQFGGYNIVQSATFPGITNPSLYRAFTNPSGAVTFTADFAITRTANALYVGRYTNWDSFGFSFLDGTGLTNLARIQFVPTAGTTNWYTLNWAGKTTNGSSYKAMTNFQRGSLYRMTATFQGNLFTLSMAGLLIQTNTAGHTTNYAVSSSAAIITNATIDNGLTAGQFARASADWLLKNTNVLEAGANYMLINSMAVSSAEVTAPALNAVTLSNALSGTYGSASGAVGFTAAGTNLSGNITAAAQSGYQVSTNQGTGYATSVSVAGGAPLWVRFTSSQAAGSYNGATAVILSSSGAANVNVTTSASNNVVAVAPLSITGLAAQNKDWDGTTTANVTGTPQYAGLVNSESFPVGGTVTWAFPDANVGTNKSLVRSGSYTAPSANYTVTQPSLTANIAATVPSAPSITGISAGNTELSVAFTLPLTNGGAAITNYAYSTNDGSVWAVSSPAVTNSPLSITNLINGVTYSVRIRGINSAGAGAASSAVQGTPVAPPVPTINVTSATLPEALTTTYGAASSAQRFTVSGSTLGGDLTVAAPAGLQVSTNPSSGFVSSLVLPQSSGSVGPAFIYVRLAAAASAGSFNSLSVSVSGGGAPTQNVATTASGNTVAPAGLTITGLSIAEKFYDGTTSATITGTASYAGLQNAESFSVAGTGSAVFATPTAGSGKTVTVSGYAAPSANYTLVEPTPTGKIKAKPLTVTGASVVTKAYDGSTSATITGAQLDGVVGQDAVSLTGATSGTFASAGAGSSIAVATEMSLTGDDADNYSLVQPTLTGNITAKSLAVTGASVVTKAYDGSTLATITGAQLDGVVGQGAVSLTGATSGTFASAGAGSDIVVATSMGLTGSAADNYTLTQPTLTGIITTKSLTVTGASVVTKPYDGNTAATITGAELDGVIGQDAVLLTGATSGIFASAGAGSGIAVATFMGLTGSAADNYTLTQPTLTGSITTTSLTATVTLGNLVQAHSGTARSATATTDPAGLMVNFTYDGSATAPTNPGTYAVTGTISDVSYRGTAAGTLVIHGPAPAADFVTKANNTTQHRYSFADLLANDTRVTANGTVLTNDGLTFVGATAGPGNSASVRSSFVYFTPSTNSPETFTYQVTDGTSTNSATVTVAVAADTNVVYSTLQVVGSGTAAYDGIDTTMTNFFIGVPNQTYGIQYKGELTNAAWDFAGATNSGASGSFGVRFQKAGNNAADWNGSMFFRGYLTNTNQ